MKTTSLTSPKSPLSTLCIGAETQRPNARTGGFSLIEMIGVLAVMAISAAMLLPALVQTSATTQEAQESALMQTFSTALQQSIQRNHVIPNVTDWVSIVATELGMTSNAVAFNAVGQPRFLLVDSNGFSNIPPLPYVEGSNGVANPFTNGTLPRLIFISSLGTPLPAVVQTNLFPLQPDFNALWSCPPGTVPTNVPWSNPTWTGNPNDITIQRLDLAYVFAHLVLSNNDNTNATFSINGCTPINLGPANTVTNHPGTNILNAYFLTATCLNLYMAGTNLEASQILNHDSSWVFSGGGWRNAPAPAPSVTVTNGSAGSGGGTVTVGGCCDNDPGDCCHQFNCQSFCTNSPSPWSGCNPNTVCNDFTNYMCLYQTYAASNFTNHACRTALQNCCNQLNNDCGSLCNYNNNY